ncbi:hydrogenobyrinic/cobyrinic acid a,c-diamide synthase [Haliea atlantica]
MTEQRCPALLISAPASGQGKTTLVAALARHHRNRGRRVRVFKTGPDFLDPKIHELACGHPVHQLDLWMVGEQACRQLLHQAAAEADLILVEGVMGLFDGDPSSADLARHFGLPVAAVIDARAMAQTFGALALGLATFEPALQFAGVVGNRVASEGHGQMLRESLPAGINWLGTLPRSEEIHLPERHLGLHQPDSIADLDSRLDAAAALIAQGPLAELPPAVTFSAPEAVDAIPALLKGRRIAVARDAAFSFVYPANLSLLQALGAELCFFSPLSDSALPDCDSLYLPGGYPELHLDGLANNHAMLEAIREYHREGYQIVAECGGMLYLLDSLSARGQTRQMAGLIEATASLGERLAGLGAQAVDFAGGQLRGHTFHYCAFDQAPGFAHTATRHPRGGTGEGVIRKGGLTASFIHWYLPSNPVLAAAMFLGQIA